MTGPKCLLPCLPQCTLSFSPWPSASPSLSPLSPLGSVWMGPVGASGSGVGVWKHVGMGVYGCMEV